MDANKYQLIELIGQDDERQTFKAYDASDGRNVIVHIMLSSVASVTTGKSLAELAQSLSARPHPLELLFVGNRDGKCWIVTEPWPDCVDIRKWLERNSGGQPPATVSPDRHDQAAAWILSGPKGSPEQTPSRDIPSASGITPSPNQAESTDAQPGDFTRRFRLQHSEPLPDRSVNSGAKAGDFSAMFAPQHSDVPPLSQPAPNGMESAPERRDPSAPDMGEFTMRFSAAAGAQSGRALSVQGTTPSNSRQAPGEFTQRFHTPTNLSSDLAGAGPAASEVNFIARFGQATGNQGISGSATATPIRDLESGFETPAFTSPSSVNEPGEWPTPLGASPAGREVPQSFAINWNASRKTQPADVAPEILNLQNVAPQAAIPSPAGPSDFTRVISAGVQKPEPPAALMSLQSAPALPTQLPQSVPSPEPTNSYTSLIVVLACLLLTAVMLVVYFVVKK